MVAGIAVTLGCLLGVWPSFEGAVLTQSWGGWSVVNGELNYLNACVACIPPMVMNFREPLSRLNKDFCIVKTLIPVFFQADIPSSNFLLHQRTHIYYSIVSD